MVVFVVWLSLAIEEKPMYSAQAKDLLVTRDVCLQRKGVGKVASQRNISVILPSQGLDFWTIVLSIRALDVSISVLLDLGLLI